MKIQSRLWRQSSSTISQWRKQLCVEDGKLAPKASVSLSSTTQWYWFSPPVQKDHKCYPTCLICLFSVSHTNFPVLSQIRTLPTQLRDLRTTPHCAA